MKLSKIFRGDATLWVVFLLLCIVSLVEVYSSIGLYVYSLFSSTTPTALFLRHMIVVIISFGVAALLSRINYNICSRFAMLGYWVTLLLLAAMLAFNEGRWIKIPVIGQFQPSEIAKVVLVIFVARMIALKKDTITEIGTFLQIMVFILLVVGLILPENFSMAALIFIVCYVMLLIGGANRKHWWLTLAGIVAVAALVLIVGGESLLHRSEIWQSRIEHWLHPDYDELTQENMAKMAIARGGFLGVGVGNTIYARLMTQAHNDFIYSIIIEETGMLGGIFVFLLYGIFYFRCVRIAWQCPGRFGALTVVGLGTVIFLQALVNMSVAVGVLPVTGQTLPFISFGGTAYVFLAVGFGIIQSVAAHGKNKEAQAVAENNNTENDQTDESNN